MPTSPVPVTSRRVLAIAVPMTLAYLSTPLLGIVDTAVIGQLGQAHLMGAIAVGAIIFDFLFWGFGFLRMGTAGLTAQALGRGDAEEQRATLARALVLAMGCGTAIIAVQAPLAWAVFAFIQASAAVEEAARLYFAVRIWSAPLAFGNFAILGWFIGLGRAGTGLVLQVFLNMLNIALNVWLVLWLDMGVVGVALGTVIAEGLALVLGLVLAGRALGWRLGVKASCIFEAAPFRRMAAVNRDIMIRTLALVFAFAFFTSQGAQAGDVTLAANAILYNLFLFAGHFLDGFATAAEQLGGRSIGARDRRGFERTTRLCILWGHALAAILAALYLLAGPAVIDLMTTSEPVRAAAREFLFWAALTPVAGVLAFQFDGLYIGATWTRTMRNMMLLSLALYVAAWWLLAPYFGNHGLWAAFNAFLAMRGLTLWWRYPVEFRRSFGASEAARA